jgi:hypothetical protein
MKPSTRCCPWRRKARPPLCRAPWPRPIKGSLSRRWRPRFAAACGPCAATSGCPASAIRPITRWFCGRNCSTVRRPRRISDPARIDAGPHGPQPQRLERHFLPRHGLPGRRAGAQCLDRPGAARLRNRAPQPPIDVYLRVIDEPVLRLTSVDLNAARTSLH